LQARLRDQAYGFVWFFIWASLIGIPVALLALGARSNTERAGLSLKETAALLA
jgi:hypothetical protein